MLAVLLLAPAPAARALPPPLRSCTKLGTVHVGFKAGRVAIITHKGGFGHQRWYVCSSKIRRPRRWFTTGGWGVTEDELFRRFGNRVGFSWVWDDGESGQSEVGWVDVRTGRARVVDIDGFYVSGIAVGSTGAIAYVDGPRKRTQTIFYVPPRGKPRAITDVPAGNVDGRTLALTRSAIEWRNTSGEKQSVALDYKPAAWQSIREFRIPTKSSKPAGIAAGPDGALWFTEYAGNRIGRVAPDGAISEFKLARTGSEPDSITAGPDGALWFTEGGANRIGRITTSGRMSEFAIPTARSAPASITVGPDGALWFTEREKNRIGRITTNGSITEFKPPSRNISLTGIAAGADGALWFVAHGAGGDFAPDHRIVRMTTAGKVTGEFAIEYYASSPALIAPAPDGTLWFTESGMSRVARITTTGAITEFETPTTPSTPTGIAPGPDGAMWFTEQGEDKIGRITADGAITEFRLPTSSASPFEIAAGQDGALWFTEYSANKIGRITTDAKP